MQGAKQYVAATIELLFQSIVYAADFGLARQEDEDASALLSESLNTGLYHSGLYEVAWLV